MAWMVAAAFGCGTGKFQIYLKIYSKMYVRASVLGEPASAPHQASDVEPAWATGISLAAKIAMNKV